MLKSLYAATALAAATIGATAAMPAAAAPIQGWYGAWTFEEPLGRIGGDSRADSVAAFVTYRLTLGPPVSGTGCRITIEGYQRYEQMQCTATPQGGSMIVKFFTMRGGAYASGTPLFTLTRGENGVVTRFQALRPSSDATPTVGHMFRRTG